MCVFVQQEREEVVIKSCTVMLRSPWKSSKQRICVWRGSIRCIYYIIEMWGGWRAFETWASYIVCGL